MNEVILETQVEVKKASEKVIGYIAIDTEESHNELDLYLESLGRSNLLDIIFILNPEQDKKSLKNKYPTQLRAKIVSLAIEIHERDLRC